MLTSSFHGISHLVGKQNSSYRIFWTCVLFLCLAGLIANAYKVVSLYLSKPISIEMKFNFDQDEYPSITFCPSTIVSNYYEIMKLNGKLFKWNKNTNWNLSHLVELGITPVWSHLYYWILTEQDALKNDEQFLNSGMQFLRESSITHSFSRFITDFNVSDVTRKDAFNLFLSCEFSFQKCTFKNFKLHHHPVYKVCFTFQISELNRRLGFPEYLSLLLFNNDININAFNHIRSLSLLRGGIYEVHSYNTMATMKNPYPYTFASRQIITISKSADKIVNSDLYPCFQNQDEWITLIEANVGFTHNILQSKYRYSANLCEQLEMQNIVFKSCRCVSSMLPLSQDQHLLFENPSTCAELPSDIFRDDMRLSRNYNNSFITFLKLNRSILLQDYIRSVPGGAKFLDEFDCHTRVMSNATMKYDAIKECYSLCNKLTYHLSVNVNIAPFSYEKSQMLHLLSEYNYDLLAIQKENSTIISPYIANQIDTENVFYYLSSFHFQFQTTEIKLVSQDEGYTLIAMLSDLGGVLGLWFGMSIATIFELFELIVQLICFRD